MKILKMTASFGKLNETMELHEGLNVCTAPNEAGKSTWSAFVLAMLYGIDTSERAGKNRAIPAKLRYKPWSGAPMQGTMELVWNGRRITLERTTTGRTPMGEFRAYETLTGQPVTELTGENCGSVLLGVERSVFERSAFLRQAGAAITKDEALEQRLNALVTTGDEGNSYSAVEQQLRTLRNRCRHNQTGLIPQCQTRLRQIEDQLDGLYQVQQDVMELSAQAQALTLQQREQARLLEKLRLAEDARKAQQLHTAEARTQACRTRRDRLAQTCAGLPEASHLAQLQKTSQALADEEHTAAMEAAFAVPTPEVPQLLPVFRGLDGAAAQAQAERDAAEYRALSGTQAPKMWLPLLLCTLALIAAGVVCAFALAVGLGCLAAVLLGGAAWLLLLRKKKTAAEQAKQQAQQLAAHYEASTPEQILAKGQACSAALAEFAQQQAQAQQQKQAAAARVLAAQQAGREFFAEISTFAPNCGSYADAELALQTADKAYAALDAAERELQQAEEQLLQLQQLVGQTQAAAAPQEDLSMYDPRQVRQQYERTTAELQGVNSRLSLCRGRISGMGDPVALEAEREQLAARLDALEQINQALITASEHLLRANEALESRFSPQIAAMAGTYLDQMTDGKYARLLLDREMNVQAAEPDSGILRPSAALSCGTVDQLYLAVRLAMARLLLPQDTPMVLDDALINFDDVRAANALRILEQEAQSRQILLFTCHGREARLLQQAPCGG